MKYADFFETYLDDGAFSTLIDEIYWEEGGIDIDRMHDYIVKRAAARNIKLDDVDDFDIDSYLTNIWNNTEKGLS
jgi:hypothetical protein